MKLVVCVVLASVCIGLNGQGFVFPDTEDEPTDITGRRAAVTPRKSDTSNHHNTKGNDKNTTFHGRSSIEIGECTCVPYYQCNDEGYINQDGTGVIDARGKSPPEQEIPLEGLDDNTSSCPGLDQTCCKEPSHGTVKPFIARCGIRNDNGINSRILSTNNKGEAEFGEWPWQAAVLKATPPHVFQCGGALIGERYILTTAHCIQKYLRQGTGRVKVRLGEWDTRNVDEMLPFVDYDISSALIHPEFKNGSLWNDIAILFTEKVIKYEPHISPICLPAVGEVFDGQDCVVTGWGKNTYYKGSYSNIMKEVAVPVIDNDDCQERLRTTRLGSRYILHEGFLCAGSKEGEDSCKGDGGGPLACYRKDGRYVQAGIVAWGIDCGMANVPGVYVRITKYLDWIAASTQQPLDSFHPQ